MEMSYSFIKTDLNTKRGVVVCNDNLAVKAFNFSVNCMSLNDKPELNTVLFGEPTIYKTSTDAINSHINKEQSILHIKCDSQTFADEKLLKNLIGNILLNSIN